MAVEFPLVLYDCKFETIKWIYDREAQEFNVTHLQQLWASHAVKTQMLYSMLQGLDSVALPCGTGMMGTKVIQGCGGGRVTGFGRDSVVKYPL